VRQFELRVVEVAALGGSIRVECEGHDPGAAAGQVCLALAALPNQPLLRVPLYLLPPRERRPAFFVPASHAFARLAPGDRLDLIGPAGRGFRLPSDGGHLLVVAASLERLACLVEAALRRGLAVTVLTPRSAELLPADVEIHRGPLDAELARWADVVALDVAEPAARAARLRALAPDRAPGYVQALHQPPMPCGVGACQACWVHLAHANARKLACVDGPVFSL
jgi:dihydroorotate dehydrogenase electron transfer subunit